LFVPTKPFINRRFPLGFPGFDPLPWRKHAFTLNNIGTASVYELNPVATLNVPSSIAAGSLIIITAYYNNNDKAPTASDTKSNVYHTAESESIGGPNESIFIFYCYNSIALTTSDSISVSVAATAAGEYVDFAASYATGIMSASNPLDATGSATGSGTSASVTSSAPATAGDLFIGYAIVPAGSVTFTQASGWATPPNNSSVNSGTEIAGNLTNASATTKTYAPSWTGTKTWMCLIASFSPPSLLVPFKPTKTYLRR
jgi:hypothetical protein